MGSSEKKTEVWKPKSPGDSVLLDNLKIFNDHTDLRDLGHTAVVSEQWLFLPSVSKQAEFGWMFCFIQLSVTCFAPHHLWTFQSD